MKNKFLNLNLILLLFLCLVGFSPQANRILGGNSVVYATGGTTDPATENEFENALNTLISSDGYSSVLTNDDSGNVNYVGNMTEGVKMFESALSSLSKGMRTFALALSVVVISIIGFKVMNSGTGDVLTFIKQKKEISNAIICVLFITAIPYFAKTVLEFKLPVDVMSPIQSTATVNETISNMVTTPKSGLKDYIIENEAMYSQDGKDRYKTIDQVLDGSLFYLIPKIGLVKLAWDIIVVLLAGIIYSPFLLITSYAGAIGFFPMSLDVGMYMSPGGDAKSVVEIAQTFFGTKGQSTVVNVAMSALELAANGLLNITVIINLLYALVKKFVMVSIEFVCYYYGVMHLMNKDTDGVGKFLIRLTKGIIGIILFPYLLEFALDVDGILAAAILRVTGPAFPGLGILSILPTVEQAKDSFIVLVLSIIMCSIVFAMAKSFFIRRIEISFLYIASPAFFMKDMLSSNGNSVAKLASKCMSSVFLTTAYAPAFALVNLMLAIASNGDGFGLIYYILIIGVLWFGKDVMRDIIGEFAGSSVAASSASHQFAKGATRVQDTASKYAKAGAKTVAGAAAYHGAKAVVDKDYRAGLFNKHVDNITKYGQAKGLIKTATYDLGKGALNIAANTAKAKFWEQYRKGAEKYDSRTLERKIGDTKEIIENRKILDESYPIKKEISDYERKSEVAKFRHKNQIFEKAKKEGLSTKEAQFRVKQYEEMIKNNITHDDELKEAKFNKERLVDKIINGKGQYSSDTINSAQLYKSRLEMASKVKADQQEALLNGDIDNAKRLEREYKEHMRIVTSTGNYLDDIDTTNYSYRDNVKALNTVNKAINNKRERNNVNVFDAALTLKDSDTVKHSLESLHSGLNGNSKMQKEVKNILDNGSFSKEGICNLIGTLQSSNVDENIIKDFANGTMTFNANAAIQGMNIVAASSAVKASAPNSYNKTISGFANVDSKVLSSTIDDLKKINGASETVNKYTTNGTVSSANEMLNMTSELLSRNVITQQDADNIIAKTMNCSPKAASETLSYHSKAKTATDTAKFVASAINSTDVESTMIDYINLNNAHLKTIRDENRINQVQGRGTVTDYSDATLFRGKDIAINQLNNLKNNNCFNGDNEAAKRLELLINDIDNAQPSDCERKIKDFFANEYSKGVVDKSQFELAANTIFMFDANQAKKHVGLIKEYSSDEGYVNKINTFDSSNSSNVMDYLNLTSGENSSHYSDAAKGALNFAANNIGVNPLSDNLKSLANSSSIDFESIEKTINETDNVRAIITKRANQVGKQGESIKEKNTKIRKMDSESHVQVDSNRVISYKENYDDAYSNAARERNTTVTKLTADDKKAIEKEHDIEKWEGLGLRKPNFYSEFQK